MRSKSKPSCRPKPSRRKKRGALRELLDLAERDPAKFMAGVRETWESVTLPDREPFNPGHRCGPTCWHKDVPSWEPDGDVAAYGSEVVEKVVRAAARFVRQKLL